MCREPLHHLRTATTLTERKISTHIAQHSIIQRANATTTQLIDRLLFWCKRDFNEHTQNIWRLTSNSHSNKIRSNSRTKKAQFTAILFAVDDFISVYEFLVSKNTLYAHLKEWEKRTEKKRERDEQKMHAWIRKKSMYFFILLCATATTTTNAIVVQFIEQILETWCLKVNT